MATMQERALAELDSRYEICNPQAVFTIWRSIQRCTMPAAKALRLKQSRWLKPTKGSLALKVCFSGRDFSSIGL